MCAPHRTFWRLAELHPPSPTPALPPRAPVESGLTRADPVEPYSVVPSLQDPGLVPTCRRLSIDMLLPLRVPYRAWAGKHGISSAWSCT